MKSSVPIREFPRLQVNDTNMTRQKSTNHSNIRLEDGDDQIAVEMRGLDDIAHGLLEVIDSSEQRERVQAIN